MKLTIFALTTAFSLTTALAQQAPPAGQKQASETGAINLTAKSANVTESGTPVKINLLRWSSDEERNSLLEAMNPTAPAPGAAAGGGRGGRGGGRGGRGDAAGAPAPPNPIASLTTAIGKAPTLGYIWTNEVTGYSIKYAYRVSSSDGGDRIILATDRRLGGSTPSWKLAAASTPTDYEFTVIEIRLDPKGVGEGKTSLTTKVAVDQAAKTIALENYSATAPMLQSVKR